ncbi:MAG: hypothetical protein L0Z53_13600 [Acidobacteriales bacterium]|nr:hypothetical protein [Terriglobales bacterium]
MENYFNYFTEIEEHFQRRRGTTLLLSTLDWALIETWKDAGIPLAAALRGIDATFDHYDVRPSKARKVNGLAFCAQEVLAAAEDMKEAAVGTQPAKSTKQTGLEADEIAAFLKKSAATISSMQLAPAVQASANEAAESLGELLAASGRMPLEDLERRLTVIEEKLFAALLAATRNDELLGVRTEADRDIAPYRRHMSAAQIEQLQRQYVRKRLLERHGIPRLSLFYM